MLICAFSVGLAGLSACGPKTRNDEAQPLFKVIPAADPATLTPAAPSGDFSHWYRSNGDQGNSRYAPFDQINVRNVAKLQVAWVYHSGLTQNKNIQTAPVIVDGILYAPATGKLLVAIDGRTGREIWRFHPPELTVGEDYGPAHRGLTYWSGNAENKPRLYFTASGYLYAVDPSTGRPITTFGDGGKVPARGAAAPVIYRNVVVASDLESLRAYDLNTGRRLWQLNIINDSNKETGQNHYISKSWGGLAMDVDRGIVYAPTSSAKPDFDGTLRPGRNPNANSVLAIDALTGKLKWSFQEVAHDLWDLDLAAPPNLVTVMRAGRRVDAVAQVTKMGNTLLLDRVTGKPLFPFRLRRAPASTLPGEQAAPYQPDIELPQPFARTEFRPENITNLTPAAKASVQRQLENAIYGWFSPPGIDRPLALFGLHGGADWPGASFDPRTGILYVSSNHTPWLVWLQRRSGDQPSRLSGPASEMELFRAHCSACHGENGMGGGTAPSIIDVRSRLSEKQVAAITTVGRRAMPPISMADSDRQRIVKLLFSQNTTTANAGVGPSSKYRFGGLKELVDDEGFPGSKPPWGTLNAINLNTGRLLWKVPLGSYNSLTARGIPATGTKNFGGPTVTAGGLVFVAGTKDNKIRAFNKTTGQQLWEYQLPAGGYAPPATYMVNGKQYIVIAATGGGYLAGNYDSTAQNGGSWSKERGDAYVAFALPN